MTEYPLQQDTVFGIYSTPEMAEYAVDELGGCGFASGRISVLLPANEAIRAAGVWILAEAQDIGWSVPLQNTGESRIRKFRYDGGSSASIIT
jgi:hypothetical protein